MRPSECIRNNGRKSCASGSGGCVSRKGNRSSTTVMLESRKIVVVSYHALLAFARVYD